MIEPTYLRYVYDHLSNARLNPNNAADLPYGFIGIYDQQFQNSLSCNNRRQTLNIFSVWALLKGPASIDLVAGVLGTNEDQIREFIEGYSSWFNTPSPSTYVLYHDRLRSYILQRMSDHELRTQNERIISFLQGSLDQDRSDHATHYALEHLSAHLLIESQMDNDYERFHEFANSEELWRRQVMTSYEYKWSQKAVQGAIKEGARRHQELNTLRSTVNSYKLKLEEENSINDILELFVNGQTEVAFMRAGSLDTKNQGLTYVLILNELLFGRLSLLDKKRDLCVRVMEQIKENDEQIDMETSFISDVVIYHYHLEFAKLNIDDTLIWRKTKSIWDSAEEEELIELDTLLDFDINLKVIEDLASRLITNPKKLIEFKLKIIAKYTSKIKGDSNQDNINAYEISKKKLTEDILKITNDALEKKDYKVHGKFFDIVQLLEQYPSSLQSVGEKYLALTANESAKHMIYRRFQLLLKLGMKRDAIKSYGKLIETENDEIQFMDYEQEALKEIGQAFTDSDSIIEVLKFLNSDFERLELLLWSCLKKNKSIKVDKVLHLLFNKNTFSANDLFEGGNALDYLVKVKERESLQIRFNHRRNYRKMFFVTIRNSEFIGSNTNIREPEWLLNESIYLTSCMKNKSSMIREFISILNEITEFPGGRINDSLQSIVVSAENMLDKTKIGLGETRICMEFFFALIRQDSYLAFNYWKKFTQTLEEHDRHYFKYPTIAKFSTFWNSFTKGLKTLVDSNIDLAEKIIDTLELPVYNWHPGKNFQSQMYAIIILELIKLGRTQEAIEYYHKTNLSKKHIEFLYQDEVFGFTERYRYKNFKTNKYFVSTKPLIDSKFSFEELKTFIDEFRISGNYKEVKEVFQNLSFIYADIENADYLKALFEGLYILEGFSAANEFFIRGVLNKDKHPIFSERSASDIDIIGQSYQPKKIDLSIYDSRYGEIKGSFYRDLYSYLIDESSINMVVKDIFDSKLATNYIPWHDLTQEYFYQYLAGEPLIEESSFLVEQDQLVLVDDTYSFNNNPFTGVSIERYHNYDLKTKTYYKNGRRDGVKEYFGIDGTQTRFEVYKNGVINEDIYSNTEAIRFLLSQLKVNKKISQNKDFLKILERENIDNRLFAEVEELIMNEYSTTEESVEFDPDRLEKLRLNNFKFSGDDDYDLQDISRNIGALIKLFNELLRNNLVDQATNVLNIADQNSKYFNQLNLLSKMENATCDDYIHSMEKLVMGYFKLNQPAKSIEIIEHLTKTFSVAITGGKTSEFYPDFKPLERPKYGGANYSLFELLVESCKYLWNAELMSKFNEVLELIENKYWQALIKAEILFEKIKNTLKDDEMLVSTIKELNHKITIEFNEPDFEIIENFNLYVHLSKILIDKRQTELATYYFNQAAAIINEFEELFQQITQKHKQLYYEEMYASEKTIIFLPEIEIFYSTKAAIYGVKSVEKELFVGSNNRRRRDKHYEWKDKEGSPISIFNFISRLYFEGKNYHDALRFACLIENKWDREKQLKKIYSKYSITDCIELFNSMDLANRYFRHESDEVDFCDYLSSEIKSNWSQSKLEYGYLSSFPEQTNLFLNLLAYKLLQTSLTFGNFDAKKIKMIDEVLTYEDPRNIIKEGIHR